MRKLELRFQHACDVTTAGLADPRKMNRDRWWWWWWCNTWYDRSHWWVTSVWNSPSPGSPMDPGEEREWNRTPLRGLFPIQDGAGVLIRYWYISISEWYHPWYYSVPDRGRRDTHPCDRLGECRSFCTRSWELGTRHAATRLTGTVPDISPYPEVIFSSSIFTSLFNQHTMSSSHTSPSSSKQVEANTVKKTRFFHAIDHRGKKIIQIVCREKKISWEASKKWLHQRKKLDTPVASRRIDKKRPGASVKMTQNKLR
jgi:hypothetical protein